MPRIAVKPLTVECAVQLQRSDMPPPQSTTSSLPSRRRVS